MQELLSSQLQKDSQSSPWNYISSELLEYKKKWWQDQSHSPAITALFKGELNRVMWEDPMNGGIEGRFQSPFENILPLIWFWRAWIRSSKVKGLLQEQVFGLFKVSYNYTRSPNKGWVKLEDIILNSFLTQNSPSCSVGGQGGVFCYATVFQFLILVHSER